MAWLAVDDGFTEHPKVLKLNDRQFRVLVNAMCYAQRRKTRGHISPEILRAMGGTKAQAQRMVEVGLWEQNGDGWIIHDWEEYNPASRDPTAAERQRRHRRRRRDEGRDDA